MNSGSLILIVAMFALLWFLLIRPQRQRQQQQQQMLDAIKPGDEVLTVGGMYGIVEEVEEDGNLIVEIAEGIQVRMARRGVAGVEKPEEEIEEEGDEELEEEPGEEWEQEPAPGEDEGLEETAAVADEGEVTAGEESVSGGAASGDRAAEPR